jgi:hypothetical protein
VDPAPHRPQPGSSALPSGHRGGRATGDDGRAGHVEFRTPSGTKAFQFESGDVIYLSARKEAAAFFCTSCDSLLRSVEFVVDVPQQAYWDVVVAFNSTADVRN